ncbi:MAG: hypothetical protein HGB10_07720 [Coriobacteriia bacterium]|nr:hypothetical protein [Coriobacteriia bacterium]
MYEPTGGGYFEPDSPEPVGGDSPGGAERSWRDDPSVVATNETVLAADARPASYSDFELAGHFAGVSQGPTTRTAMLTLGAMLLVVLVFIAGIVYLPQLAEGSVIAWTVAFVLMVALAEIIAATIVAWPHSSRRPARETGLTAGAIRFAARLVLVTVFVAAMWVLLAGGWAERIGTAITAPFEPPLQSATAPVNQPTNPGVIVAKNRLRETQPDIYKATTNLNEPVITLETEGRTSYTWSYTPDGAAAPVSHTITLDIEGKVVSP